MLRIISYSMKAWLMAIVLLTSASSMAKTQPKIQIAILLDGSGSMQGLINQTRNQLWKIVNALVEAKKDGQTPTLEVALYEHGKGNLTPDQGYLQQLRPLTTDLDSISEKLFGITASGSQEFVGLSIQKATDDLKWSESDGDFRVIFVAGNETAQQGPVDFVKAVEAAVGEGIIVNAIHAGSESAGVNGRWKELADKGQGQFTNIDHNAAIPHIETVYDPTILKLNEKLNETYIPYGQAGILYKKRQLEEDKNSGENLVSRGLTKGSAYYRNASWDLVDAIDEGLVKLEDVKDEDLPEEMRGLTLEEKEKYVDVRRQARKRLRIALQEVGKLRKEVVDEKIKEIEEEQGATFEKAMIEILRTQLQDKGFSLES